jgi:pimeloyl-ACP methyl ester carboxylesterase
VKGLNAIPVDTITSRNEADAVLAEFVPEVDVRQFLLKNLQRKTEGGFSWKINLPLITQQLGNIGVDLQFNGKFDKPTLFIRGRRSKYILDSDLNRIKEVFPQATLETMETGHWVQAENPQEFVDLVMKWVQ